MYCMDLLHFSKRNQFIKRDDDMTPLQTPPPVSAPLEAAPALKPQNQWITDESRDGIDSTPVVSFPLLMPQRSVPPLAHALSALTHEQALPAPSLQPQSFEFLKFPALKQEDTNSLSTAIAAAIPQPIPIRPSECFRGRSPSLQLILDNELNQKTSEPTATTNSSAHQPQIRIQPLNSSAKTPSHLARRGIEERTYLESQLRAEESLRRKRRVHNEERKARTLIINDDEDAHSDEISALMEKFTDFQLNNEQHSHADCLQWVPQRNDKMPSSSRENVAPSPPIILQKSLKRSVSSVIADSRGQEDEDGCFLFFPDGLPLVDECNETMSRNNSLASLENCTSFDLESKCTLSPHTHDVTEGSTPFGTVSYESTPNSVECQPVLFGGEAEGGAPHFLRLSKKMMLRPKMTMRPETPAKLKQTGGAGAVPDQIDCNQRLFDLDCPDIAGFSAIPDLEDSLLSMEADDVHLQQDDACEEPGPSSGRSFRRLDSEATIICKNSASDDDLDCIKSFDCPKSATKAAQARGWNYSSPEPIRRSQFRANGSMPPPPQVYFQETTPIESSQPELREPLSESDYCTPNHSNCTMRQQLAVKPSGVLDTLEELFLPSLNKSSQPSSFDEELSGLEGVAKTL